MPRRVVIYVSRSFPKPVVSHLTGSQSCETTLPQDPKADKVARRNQLIEKQKEYRWNDEEDKEVRNISNK